MILSLWNLTGIPAAAIQSNLMKNTFMLTLENVWASWEQASDTEFN